jgi:hypothetical protein
MALIKPNNKLPVRNAERVLTVESMGSGLIIYR